MGKWQVKAMMIVFFDIRSVIMIDWVHESNGLSKVLLEGPDQAPRTGEEEIAGIVGEAIFSR
jgi:hypothetical protein